MKPGPEHEQFGAWQRYFAVEANNRAWRLADRYTGPSDDDALLDAAHAAAWHWQAIGTVQHHMRATMLLAHVHALRGDGELATHYAKRMRDYFVAAETTEAWELALTHVIYANAARVSGVRGEYVDEYAKAQAAFAEVQDQEERQILAGTFAQVPGP